MSQRFYCPKCGHRTLAPAWSSHPYRILSCEYGVLPYSVDSDLRYGSAEDKIKAQKWIDKHPVCGLVISHPSRNAEPSDWATPLDRIARATNNNSKDEFYYHLLETDKSIIKSGLCVLYKTDFLAVARFKQLKEDTGIFIYFIDAQATGYLPEHNSLCSAAAKLIQFEGIKLPNIFQHHNRFQIWSNRHKEHRFLGGEEETEELHTEVINWATRFEQAFPSLRDCAIEETARWNKEKTDLKTRLKKAALTNYNGQTKLCSISLDKIRLTLDQAIRIDEILCERDHEVSL